MSWFMSTLASSVRSVLGLGAARAGSVNPDGPGLQDLRQAMLALLVGDDSARAVKLARRVRCAPDVQTLWFARGDLMGVLAATRGEAAALEEMQRLRAEYHDLLPVGLQSRPSPLGRSDRFGPDSRPPEPRGK